MRVMVLGMCCGILLAISAIADERPQDHWFSTLDHNDDGGISLNEVAGSTTWSGRFIRLDTNTNGHVNLAEFGTMALTVISLFDINANSQIAAHDALKSQHKEKKKTSAKKVFN
jgi:hypothetical protein